MRASRKVTGRSGKPCVNPATNVVFPGMADGSTDAMNDNQASHVQINDQRTLVQECCHAFVIGTHECVILRRINLR